MSEITRIDENESTTVSVAREAISALNSGDVNVYSSIGGDSFDSKMETLRAVTNSVPISDHIGAVINLRHVVVQVVEVESQETKELVEVPRVILIDDEGVAFHAVSNGIFKAVENFIGMLGEPSNWPAPVPTKVVKGKAKVGSFYTLELA